MKKHVENNRKIRNKVIKAVAPVALIGVLAGGIAACSKKSDTVETINIATPTPTPTPVEEVIEEEVIVNDNVDLLDLDVYNDDSVHAVAEQFYTNNQLFCVTNSLTVQNIEEAILVLNGRYDGINSDLALDTLSNVNTMLESDEFIEGICVANQLYNNDIDPERLENLTLIPTNPDVTQLIDRHIEGSDYVVERLTEYQEMVRRETSAVNAFFAAHSDVLPQFEGMLDESIDRSTVLPHAREDVNNYFFHMEEALFPVNSDFMNNTNNTDGYRWIIAEIGENTCGIVGQVNPNTISLTNPDTGHNLKINPTVRQADMVNLFMNYQYYDAAVPVDLMEEWNEYITTMPETKYQETVCSIEADVVNRINIANGISGYTYTLSN